MFCFYCELKSKSGVTVVVVVAAASGTETSKLTFNFVFPACKDADLCENINGENHHP